MNRVSKSKLAVTAVVRGKLKHSHPVLLSRLAFEPAGIEFTARDLLPGLYRIMGHGCTAPDARAAPILLADTQWGT